MVTRIALIAAALLLLAPLSQLRAGDTSMVSAPADVTGTASPEPSKFKTSYEFNADTSYVGDARTNFGSHTHGDLSEERTRSHLVVAPQYDDGPIYRFGLAYQRYSFGFSRAAALPDILQSENLIVGMDFQLFNSWLVRVEADPGFYGDGRSVGMRDFNVPFLIGGSYIASADVQWIVGLDVDVDRQLPVIPAIGVRWAFTDNWVINAVLPTPRLEYDWSKALTLYVGGDVDDGTFKMDRGLGTALGKKDLSGAVVEYGEIRVGAGFSWKATKAVTLELEGGYLPYREFDFHRADEQFTNSTGAPYGQMSINAQF
jgi:opacity protein-like surface antigen